jgi:hypothetical protein
MQRQTDAAAQAVSKYYYSSSSLKEELLNLKRTAIKRNPTLHRLHVRSTVSGRGRPSVTRKSGIACQRLRGNVHKRKRSKHRAGGDAIKLFLPATRPDCLLCGHIRCLSRAQRAAAVTAGTVCRRLRVRVGIRRQAQKIKLLL